MSTIRCEVIALVYSFVFVLTVQSSIESPLGCFDSIISFGDSLADTGNLLRLSLASNKSIRYSHLPYGETYFKTPTGRESNGRLIIDFIAESLGLPPVQPYVGGENANVSNISFGGINFAVGGATALDQQFLDEKGIYNPLTNASLGIQLNWFKQFLSTLPGNGKTFVQGSLVLLGEIGGNDYNNPLTQQITMDEIHALVPQVISFIGQTLIELINLGAESIVVPGNFPIGCLSVYQTQFKTNNMSHYDPITGCINWLNEFSSYHNDLLRKELFRIQELHPSVNIIYADYYNAAMRLFLSPKDFGFENVSLRACCGGGGYYNYNKSALCGTSPSTSCPDPSVYINWDGIHFTESAYKLIAQSLLHGMDTHPRFQTICSSKQFKNTGAYKY